MKRSIANGWSWLLLGFVLMVQAAERCSAQDAAIETDSAYLAHLAAANSALRLHETQEARRWLEQIPEAARGWEWRYLHARSNSSRMTHELQDSIPTRMDVSSDGERLIVAGDDGKVRVYSTNDLSLEHEWQVSERSVYAAHFTPNATRALICAQDGYISLWDVASKERVWSQLGRGEGRADVVFSPTGESFLFCSWAYGSNSVVGFVSLRASDTGEEIWKSEFGVKPIVSARFSPDGSRFAVGNWDGQVALWNTKEHGEPIVLDFSDLPETSAIDQIAFSPDGLSIAAANQNGIVRVWSLGQQTSFVDFVDRQGAASSVEFSQDGTRLLIGGVDGVLSVWSIADREVIHRFFGHDLRVTSIAVPKAGNQLFSCSEDRSIRSWSLRDMARFDSPNASRSSYGLVLVDEDQSLISGGQTESVVTVWNTDGETEVRTFPGASGTTNYLSAAGSFVAGGNWGGNVSLWDWKTGELLSESSNREYGGMQQCAMSPDGKWLVYTTTEKLVVCWNVETRRLERMLLVEGGAWGVDFAADSSHVAIGGNDGTIHWFSAETWSKAWTSKTELDKILCVRVSPDGSWLAAGSESGKLVIMSTNEGEVRKLIQGHTKEIWSIDIAPDQSRIVTGSADAKVRFWEPQSGSPTLTLSDFTGMIYNLRFSSSGQSLYVNDLGTGIMRLDAR